MAWLNGHPDFREGPDLSQVKSVAVIGNGNVALDVARVLLMDRGALAATDVAQLNAEVVDVTEESSRYIVSVRFTGLIGEDGQAPQPFDEIWHMTKPTDGSRGWVIAGIQQVQ